MTLWERIDRGRPLQFAVLLGTGLGFTLTTYALALGIAWTALIGPGAILLAQRPLLRPEDALTYANAIALALSVGLLLRMTWLAGEGPARLVSRVGPRLPALDEYQSTREALHDMKLAAGLPEVPDLRVIDRLTVNAAAVVGRTGMTVVVTHGFATRLCAREQRAVFASLLGRQRFARQFGLQVLAAMTEPAQRVQGFLSQRWSAVLTHGDQRPELEWTAGLGMIAIVVVMITKAPELGAWLWVTGWLLVTTGIIVMTSTWLSTLITYRIHIVLAHHGDAEGMMLLKDPAQMISAIQAVIDHDNEVVFADTCGPLFFCWPREPVGRLTDPELSRIARLRRLLGVAGHRV